MTTNLHNILQGKGHLLCVCEMELLIFSTRHKLESFGKWEPQLDICLYQISLWVFSSLMIGAGGLIRLWVGTPLSR